MLYLIPCIYILSFLNAGYGLVKGKPQFILHFYIFGLPIYITSLSLLHQLGLGTFIPLFQGFKEIITLSVLIYLLSKKEISIQFTLIDKMVLLFLAYTSCYVLLPLGNYGIMQKVLALKSLSFFPFIYFTGRLINPQLIDINKLFHYILLVSIAGGIVLLGENMANEHLQIHTGYAEFFQSYFDTAPSGNYNLSWTFETSNGLKRYASFYGGPLELGVNTIFTLAAILALYSQDNNSFKLNQLGVAAMVVSLLSIVLAISRASMVSYFLVFYVFAIISQKKYWLKLFHYGMIGLTLLVLFYLKGDIYELIITTINFSDNSSAYHVLQWLEGIEAIASHPLGLGLGMSGRVSGAVGDNIGGENQLIIIGVQAGLIAVLIYLSIYYLIIKLCIEQFKKHQGKIKKLALCLLLVKIGLFIPTLTANVESYIYIAYLSWFCAGLLNSMSKYPALQKN